MNKFGTSMGIKGVINVRIAQEIKDILKELADCTSASQGELIEMAINHCFREGLLCTPKDKARIAKKLNEGINKALEEKRVKF